MLTMDKGHGLIEQSYVYKMPINSGIMSFVVNNFSKQMIQDIWDSQMKQSKLEKRKQQNFWDQWPHEQ